MATFTRAQIRRTVGTMLGDVTALSANANGTTTTFIDTVNLSGNIENPYNRDIIFRNSTAVDNDARIRRITHSDLLAGWVAFEALSYATYVDDQAEMYNFRGKGWRVVEYNEAINQAIREANVLGPAPDTATLLASDIDGNVATISTTGLTSVYSVQYLQGESWIEVSSANRQTGYEWWTDGGVRLVLNGYTNVLNGLDDNELKIYGHAPRSEFDDDADSISINMEWMTNKVAEILCASALDRDQGNFARAQMFGRKASMTESAIRTRKPGSSRSVNAGL